jgi:hypothetical protein
VRAPLRPFARALALGLAVASLAASGCHRDRCISTCEQRAKELNCPPHESCKATCDKLHSPPVCGKEYKEYERCFLDLPASKWLCYGDQPVPNPVECPAQRHTLETCLSAAPPPSEPAPAAH